MKTASIFRIFSAISLVTGLLFTVPMAQSLAACDGEGTTTVDCTEAGSPYIDTVDGSAGDDTITVESGAAVEVANGAAIDTQGGNDAVNIEAGAAVESCDDVADHVGIDNASGTMTVNNEGSITTCGDGAFQNTGIQNDSGDNFVDNSGDISATGNSDGNVGIATNSGNSNVNNSGAIMVSGNTYNTGIYNYGSGTTHVVSNSGSIEATGSGSYASNTGIHTQYGALNLDNNGEIVATGSSQSNYGVSMYSGSQATVNNAGSILVESADGDTPYNAGIRMSVNSEDLVTIINSGDILVSGDGGYNYGVETNNQYAGYEASTPFYYNNSGNIIVIGDTFNMGVAYGGGPNTTGTVINSGTISVSGSDDDYAISTGSGADTVILTDGSFTSGDLAVSTNNGNDTVILGGPSVTYSQQCGDITTVQVTGSGAVVQGLIDGGDDADTIVFGIATPNPAEVANLDAYIASLGGTNTAIVNGQTYDYANFENYSIDAVIYSEGATKLFDDGVVLAFAQANGIAVCSGEAGQRVGTIDFAALASGQTTFSANGWSVQVNALGGGQYQVRLFDSAGHEHFNDANNDGAADSLFVFSH